MPTLRSMYHGGISRAETRVLIARAQGRTSSYVMSDMGATDSGRWHTTHDRYRMGATCLVNVTSAARRRGCCAIAEPLASKTIMAIAAITSAARGFHAVLIVDLQPCHDGHENCSHDAREDHEVLWISPGAPASRHGARQNTRTSRGRQHREASMPSRCTTREPAWSRCARWDE